MQNDARVMHRFLSHEKPPRWTINPPHDVAEHAALSAHLRGISVSAFFVELARAHMTSKRRAECASCADRLFVEEIVGRLAGHIAQVEHSKDGSTRHG